MIWPQEVTLARWTQPSGPLCLWQCLCFMEVCTPCSLYPFIQPQVWDVNFLECFFWILIFLWALKVFFCIMFSGGVCALWANLNNLGFPALIEETAPRGNPLGAFAKTTLTKVTFLYSYVNLSPLSIATQMSPSILDIMWWFWCKRSSFISESNPQEWQYPQLQVRGWSKLIKKLCCSL